MTSLEAERADEQTFGISTSCLGKGTTVVSHESYEDLQSKEHEEESPSAEGLRELMLRPVGIDGKTEPRAAAFGVLVDEAAIGEGGTAAVYMAHLPANHGHRVNRVALKVFNKVAGTPIDRGDGLLREATMLAAVQGHPNIIRFHGAFDLLPGGEDKDTPHVGSHDVELHSQRALMTEYCDGSELYYTIRQSPLNEDGARGIVRAVLGALAHIHSLGIVHRDVKPENVLMGCDGRPMLVDFGCACRLSDSEALAKKCGSPGYVAPEVLLGACVGIEVDSFGLGAMLFSMLYFRPPFSGSNISSTLRRTVRGKFTFPESPIITLACTNVIVELLQCDPRFRPCAEQALCNPWFDDGTSTTVDTQERMIAQQPCVLGHKNTLTVAEHEQDAERPSERDSLDIKGGVRKVLSDGSTRADSTEFPQSSFSRKADVSCKSIFSEPTPPPHPCSEHRFLRHVRRIKRLAASNPIR